MTNLNIYMTVALAGLAGLGIVTYVPNALPSVYAIYSTIIFGESDPVAATLAALETMYFHCPSCIEEARKFNSVLVGGWTSSAYMLACREPLRTMAEQIGAKTRIRKQTTVTVACVVGSH